CSTIAWRSSPVRSRRGVPALAFGLCLGVLTAIGAAFPADVWVYALLGSSGFGMTLLGLWLTAVPEPREEGAVRTLPLVSWTTVAAAVGAGAAFVGSIFGLWLVLPGLGLFALSLLPLARELL